MATVNDPRKLDEHDQILLLLNNHEYDKAHALIKEASQEKQKAMFKSMADALARKLNSAINEPNAIAIIQRELKDGVTFEEFYEAWKPQASSHFKSNEGKNQYHYLDIPSRTIVVQNVVEPTEVFTVTMFSGFKKDVQSEIDKITKKIAQSEKIRTEKLEKVVKPNSEKRKLYYIYTDELWGK